MRGIAVLFGLLVCQGASGQRVVAIEGGPVDECLKAVLPNSTIACSGGLLSKGGTFTDLDVFESYAGDLSVGNSIAFSFGADKANLYSELVGANLHLGRLGYARAGFGALVAADDDSTATTADQFFDGGGNASFYIALPLYYGLAGVRGTTGDPFLSRRLDAYLVTSVGADLPLMNAAAEDRAALIQVGPQITFSQNATDEAIRMFAQVSGGYAVGTEQFYENAGAADSPRAGFLYTQATFGIVLNGLIRVGGTIGTSTVSTISRPLELSVQLLPQGSE